MRNNACQGLRMIEQNLPVAGGDPALPGPAAENTADGDARYSRKACELLMRERYAVIFGKGEQQLGQPRIRLQKGHAVYLGGEHADGAGEMAQQVKGQLWVLAETVFQAGPVNGENFAFFQCFGGGNARLAVKKRGFAK